MSDARTDSELLAATPRDPAAFGEFYLRHEDAVLLYMRRRVSEPELAADLAAETFAQAIVSCERFQPGAAPPIAWLFGIARNVLAMSRRRGRVETAARKKLAMQPMVLDDEDLARIDELTLDGPLSALLASLPLEQREAVEARVIDEKDYVDIARELKCSEQVVRKRVSRGLTKIRTKTEASR